MHVEMNTLNTGVQEQKENSSFLKLTFTKEGIKVVLTNVTIYREKEKVGKNIRDFLHWNAYFPKLSKIILLKIIPFKGSVEII